MNQPLNHEKEDEAYFEIKDINRKVYHLNYDDVDYLVESVRLGYPRLCPETAPSEEQRKDPAYIRMIQGEIVKCIGTLTEAFNKEYKTQFGQGTINKLWSKLFEYKASLKKNTVEGQPSSAPSTDSTCSESLENTTTTTPA